MPGNQRIDNTYYIFNQATTAVADWPSGASIANIRFWTVGTDASIELQLVAGTPWLRFDYLSHGVNAGAGSGASVIERMYVLPFFGKRQSSAIIPTTLTAASAWVEFV